MKRSLASQTAAELGKEHTRRVLIVRIGAMGDVLHALPAVAALRQSHPEWFLAWAIEPRWSELLQSSHNPAQAGERGPGKPLVDSVVPVPTQQWRKQPFAFSTLASITTTSQKLRAGKFDLCVDMQGSIKSGIIGRISGAKLFAGPADPREKQAAHLYSRKIPLHAEHVIDQACELLGTAIGEPLQPARVPLPVDGTEQRWCDALLSKISPPGEQFVFLAPTAGWGAKQWPAERFGAVAAALAHAGYRVLINAPQNDRAATKVIAASEGAATVVPCSVGQMIALIRRTALVIAGDTGPLHLAAALGIPVVALFGPTDPARNGPYGTRSAVLRHPSSRRDHKRLAHTETGLLQITAGEVVQAALGLLQSGQDKVNP